MKKYNFSKTYIAAFLNKFAFLLFVPFLQALIFAPEGIDKLLTLYGADLAVVVLLWVISFIRCSKGKVYANEKKAFVKKGALITSRSIYSYRNLNGAIFTRGFFLRLFGGCKVKLFSGTVSEEIFLRFSHSAELASFMKPNCKTCRTYKNNIPRTFIMSATFSNSLTGLLAAVPILRRTAAVMGANQTALIIESVYSQGFAVFAKLSPVLRKTSSLIILLWIIGLCTEFFREYRLTFQVDDFSVKAEKGLITKTTAVFPKASVASLRFDRSLILYLCGFESAKVIMGTRPKKGIPLLSAASKNSCRKLESEFFRTEEIVKLSCRPPASSIFGYTWLPLLGIFLCFSAILIINTYLFAVVLLWLLCVFSLIFILWFIFRIIAFRNSSLTVKETVAELKSFSGLTLTRFVFYKEKISVLQTSQNPFQRFRGRCNLKLKIKTPLSLTIKIKHLKKTDCENFKKLLLS